MTGKASDASAAAQDTATGAASHAQKVAGDSYGHAQKVAGDSYGHAQKVAGDSYDAAKGTAYDTAASGRMAAHDAAAQAGTTWEKAKNVVADVVDKVGRLPAAVCVCQGHALISGHTWRFLQVYPVSVLVCEARGACLIVQLSDNVLSWALHG